MNQEELNILYENKKDLEKFYSSVKLLNFKIFECTDKEWKIYYFDTNCKFIEDIDDWKRNQFEDISNRVIALWNTVFSFDENWNKTHSIEYATRWQAKEVEYSYKKAVDDLWELTIAGKMRIGQRWDENFKDTINHYFHSIFKDEVDLKDDSISVEWEKNGEFLQMLVKSGIFEYLQTLSNLKSYN